MATTLDDARNRLAEGDLEGARDALVDVLYEDYDNLEAWLLLTECAADTDEYARAIREALRIDPENPIARRLAVELARQGPPISASGEAKARQQTSNAVRSVSNLIIFFVIVAIGTSIAIFVALSGEQSQNQNNPSNSSNDTAAFCEAAVQTTYNRLEARCGLLEPASLCLGNLTVNFDVRENATLPLLPGDRVPAPAVIAFNTERYVTASGEWGIVVGQINDNGAIQMIVTSGVRVSGIEEQLASFVISSSPLENECGALPPPGVLLNGTTTAAPLEINGMQLMLDGVIFIQVDAAGGLRIVTFNGGAELRVMGNGTESRASVRAGEWTTLPVNPRLQVIGEIEVPRIGDPPIRGNLSHIAQVAEALGLDTAGWQFPAGAVEVAIQPTPTPTRGIRIPSATPTPTITNTPRQTATLRPTRTPTATLVPTSTTIPVLEATPDERLPESEQLGPPEDTPLSPTPIPQSPVSGTWQCEGRIDTINFAYILTIEPGLVRGRVLASAVVPAFGNTIVTLNGTLETVVDNLDANWTRIPSYQEGDTWLLLNEDAVLYTASGNRYDSNGTFRLIHNDGNLRGGIFEDERLIGTLASCELRE